MSASCGEAHIKYSEEQQAGRALAVQYGALTPPKAGCHGPNLFKQRLHYVSQKNLQPIPLAHALCYGVVKDLLKYLLGYKRKKSDTEVPGITSSQARKVMAARASLVKPTADFNRGYRDIVKCRGQYVMEEYLNFVETWSVFIIS